MTANSSDLVFPTLNELPQFLGGYFHQHWESEFRSVDDAVDQYIADSENATIAIALDELDQVVAYCEAQGLADAELGKRIAIDMGCFYRPATENVAFLRSLATRLRQQFR